MTSSEQRTLDDPDGPFCCTYFGSISVSVDHKCSNSSIHIANYLLLKATDFIIDDVIEELACTHNYAFFLSRKPSIHLYRIRIDGHRVACLDFAAESFQKSHFRLTNISVEMKSMQIASCQIPELIHCEGNEKYILDRIRTSRRPSGAPPSGSICCTDSSCYLMINSETGPSLWRIFSENRDNGITMLQIGCKEPIISMASGKCHVLLLNSSGLVYSFGTGSRGELGHGTLESEQMPKLIDVLSLIPIIEIACGAWHSVALTKDGDVYVWGWNSCGQLSANDSIVNFPLPLNIDDEIIAVSAYRNATLLMKADNKIVMLGTIGFNS